MEEKPVISGINISFSGVKKGELVVTQNEVYLHKRKSLFSPASVIRHFPLSEIAAVQAAPDQRLRIEGTKESGEIFVETITFDSKTEEDQVIKHLQDYLEQKAQKTRAEEEEKEAKKREEEKARVDQYRQYIHGNLSLLWSINRNLFRLCAAIPQAEWNNIKELMGALQKSVEPFVKLNALDKAAELPDFLELAEKEDLPELEKGAAGLLGFLADLMGKSAPEGTPAPVDSEALPEWQDLKYFFLYTAYVGEAGMLIDLDEPGELFQTAGKLERLAPVIEDKFGLPKDKALVSALKLPKKHEEALVISRKLAAEVDSYLKQVVEEKR